jgi:hypothetical protein
MSGEMVSLVDVIERLEKAKIEELKELIEELKGLTIEMSNYANKDTTSFVITNNFGLRELSIEGRYSGKRYFTISVNPEKTTISEIFNKFFSDTASFYEFSLRYAANILNAIVSIIESALAKRSNS